MDRSAAQNEAESAGGLPHGPASPLQLVLEAGGEAGSEAKKQCWHEGPGGSPLPAPQEVGSRVTAQGGSEPANRLPAPTSRQDKHRTKYSISEGD